MILRARREARFDHSQRRLESALRGRTARRVRGHLRQLEPVAMVTPRWSAPQAFLEEIALDLAVGEPRVLCRTISLRPMLGRSTPEAWNFLLRVMGDLCGPEFSTRPVPVVCDRRGFLYAADALLDLAQDASPTPVALLAHGTEHLPVEVLTDLAEVWARYAEQARDSRRCTLLVAGAVETPAFHVNPLPPIELTDYAEAEAAAALFPHAGPGDAIALQRAVLLSGGVPAIVQAIVARATALRDDSGLIGRGFRVARRTADQLLTMPSDPGALLRAIGPLAEELRASVAVALTDPEVAGRFYALGEQGALDEHPVHDLPLLHAGLARRVRGRHGTVQVELRTPALALLAS